MRNRHSRSLECLLRHPEKSFSLPEPKRISKFTVNCACVDVISSNNEHIWRHMRMTNRMAAAMDMRMRSLDLASNEGVLTSNQVILNGVQWMAGLREAISEHSRNKVVKQVKFSEVVTVVYVKDKCSSITESELGEELLSEKDDKDEYCKKKCKRHTMSSDDFASLDLFV